MPKIPKSIGNLLRGLADTFFWSIIHVLDSIISAVTGGIYKDAISRIISGEDLGAIVIGGLVMAATDLIETTESTIISVVGELENRISAHFTELLGLTDLQKRIAESLQLEIEAITAKYKKEAEEEELTEEEAARELAKRTMEVIGDRANLYLDEYSLWMARFTQLEGEEEKAYYETSITGMEMAQRMLEIDLSLIHDMGEERKVAAVNGMVATIEETLDTANEWGLEVGVKPLAYGDMGMRILSEMLDMPVDEIKEQLRIISQLQYEVADEMIPKYKAGE